MIYICIIIQYIIVLVGLEGFTLLFFRGGIKRLGKNKCVKRAGWRMKHNV